MEKLSNTKYWKVRNLGRQDIIDRFTRSLNDTSNLEVRIVLQHMINNSIHYMDLDKELGQKNIPIED